MDSARKSLVIIDGYSFVFRAYYSLPPLSTKSGIPVGAIYGFANMLHRILEDSKTDFFAVVFDAGKVTFRSEIYPAYKANRPEPPDDLREQFPLIREVTEALNINALEQVGVEADDIIASLVKLHNDKDITIFTGDKDLMQLVDDRVKIYDPIRKKTFGEAEVFEKFKVKPTQILDYLSLVGDSSDNIPGVPSIGPKSAVELLSQFNDLDGVYANLENIPQKKRKQVLIDFKDQAYLSQKLVTLKNDVDLDLSEDIIIRNEIKLDKLQEFCLKYEFTSLLNKISKDIPQSIQKEQIKQENIDIVEITKKEELFLLEQILTEEKIFIHYFAGKEFYCCSEKKIYKLQLAAAGQQDLLQISESLELSDLKLFLAELLTDSSIAKICLNFKDIINLLISLELISNNEIDQFFQRRDFIDLDAMNYLIGKTNEYYVELSDNLKKFTKDSSGFAEFCSEIISKFPYILLQLKEKKLFSLYHELDFPIAVLLLKTERAGFKISLPLLKKLSEGFAQEIKSKQDKIYALAGEEFNIASPKQLGHILYEKLGLDTKKKSSKTKAKSTSHEVLEELANNGHEICAEILAWRHYAKLKSTYTDSLQNLVDENDRVHTTLNPTLTSTGRLSSTNPNLQNIPVRSADGDRIRESFIAKEGYKLIAADYSQIELRLLAHIAKVEALSSAFAAAADIHKATAMEVFSLSKDEVTADFRRKAKTINFGIIYGISAFGLAERLNISRTEAKEFIEKYFQRFPEIKQYMEDIVNECKKTGYVSTLSGRKLYFPNITNKNAMLRSFTERAVINAPLQGSAADIIKIAMLNIEKQLTQKQLAAKLILQVHDELIYEVKEEQAEQVLTIVKNSMEKAYKLSIPLTVDANIGNNWHEIH